VNASAGNVSDGTRVRIPRAVFGYGGRSVVLAEDLCIRAGAILGMFGPNGAGKTTLVHGLSGLLKPIEGTVERERGLRFAYVAQQRAMELHWPMTGLDAAGIALSASRWFGRVRGLRERLAPSLRELDVVNLLNERFATLSGGQQQRLMLAGALATEPHVLVLDEPTEGLDVRSRRLLLDILRRKSAAGVSVVLISHDTEDLLELCGQIAWLHPGSDERPEAWVECVGVETFADRLLRAAGHV